MRKPAEPITCGSAASPTAITGGTIRSTSSSRIPWTPRVPRGGGLAQADTESISKTAPAAELKGWGWQDNGWGVGVSGPPIHRVDGPHVIRITTREDGFSIDQSSYHRPLPYNVSGSIEERQHDSIEDPVRTARRLAGARAPTRRSNARRGRGRADDVARAPNRGLLSCLAS